MDKASFNTIRQMPAPNLQQMLMQARQNPKAFEEQFKRENPQAYQQAMQLRNSGNARSAVMQMLQAKGINPNIIQMLGLQ
jgi:uncharacterized protein YllA (UPF0747 family)